MRLGDTANDDAARCGKPVADVRILTVEQGPAPRSTTRWATWPRRGVDLWGRARRDEQ